MARYVLLVLCALALCGAVLAQRWPAGLPDGEELSKIAASDAATTMTAYKHKYKYKKSHSPHSYKKASGDYEDKKKDQDKKGDDDKKKPDDKPAPKKDDDKKPDDSPYYKTYEPEHDPFHHYSEGYYPGMSKDAYNTPTEHIWEHVGPCIGSNHVKASGPLNGACPGPNVLNQAQVSPCKVPEVCQNLPGGAEPCTCPTGEFARFGTDNVADHFSQQPGPFPMVDVKHSTYECVDARGFGPMIATPGGDLAELTAVAMALMKLTGKSWDHDLAKEVFDIFAEEVASPSRPLYFHTDDIRLRNMFKELKGKLQGEPKDFMPSILPFRAPDNEDDAELWITNLKKAEFQGCGHIRLMTDEPTRKEYSLSLDGDAVAKCPAKAKADDCVDSKRVAQYMIGRFFRFWWFTASGSAERRRIAFQVDGILQGPLLGKGVAVISNTPKDACPDHAPAIRPAFGGSQVFLYHGDAVGKWRAYVAETYLAGLAKSSGVTVPQLIKAWNDVTGLQLGATLVNLVPANRVGLFSVEVPTLAVEEENEEYEKEKQT